MLILNVLRWLDFPYIFQDLCKIPPCIIDSIVLIGICSAKMGWTSTYFGLLALLLVHTEGNVIPRSSSVEFLGPLNVKASGLHNIHIRYSNPLDGDLSIHYGDCAQSPRSIARSHHRVGATSIGSSALTKRNLEWLDSRPERFVWVVPASIPDLGCLQAYLDEDELVGVSQPIQVMAKQSRRGVPIADYVDAEGPWFDGVQYISEKEPNDVFVAKAKGSSIGILGGGMSGLMSAVSFPLVLGNVD